LDTSCNYTLNTGAAAASKRYIISVPAGTKLTVTMTSTAFSPYVELVSISGSSRTFQAGGPGAAGVSITPVSETLYEIRATQTGGVPTAGAFTLTIAP
jgi:H+/gluconate symporter-like permease